MNEDLNYETLTQDEQREMEKKTSRKGISPGKNGGTPSKRKTIMGHKWIRTGKSTPQM